MQDLSRYKKKDHIEIQAKYVSFLVVGSVALVGLVFALGLLVGSRGAAAPACPPADPLEALDARSGEPAPPQGTSGEFKTFHETLTQPTEAAATTPASLLPSAASDGEALAAAVPIDEQALARPKHAESPVPEEVRDGEPGTYSLQVDSFSDRREASVLLQKLAKAGHAAFLVSVDNPERGGQWYRVRIGPFSNKAAAWKYKRMFEEKEHMATFVVKRKSGDV
ncbi:MAG: SPOR domain-containing protein [Proteobacteria bacterium]|jgi:cell division protein FtsN|nr:SPOR domain-containing protein [Pseudomonadota bacterium]